MADIAPQGEGFALTNFAGKISEFFIGYAKSPLHVNGAMLIASLGVASEIKSANFAINYDIVFASPSELAGEPIISSLKTFASEAERIVMAIKAETERIIA